MPYFEDEDVEQQNDAEYLAAHCNAPHDDGSSCLPSSDGVGYVCTYRIVNNNQSLVEMLRSDDAERSRYDRRVYRGVVRR